MRFHPTLVHTPFIAAIALVGTVAPRALMRRLAPPDPCATPPAGHIVPTDFVAGRFLARWKLHNGHTLHFYLDSGGPVAFFPSAVAKLGLPVDSTTRGSRTIRTVTASDTLGDDALPLPLAPRFDPPPTTDSVPVLVAPQPPLDYGTPFPVDGVFGSYWYAGHVWTLDYPHHRMYVSDAASAGPTDSACWVPLGFQTYKATGIRTTRFPRITARIGADSIDFLVDTGAMMTLTDSAWQALGARGPKQRATSFITQRWVDRWHAAHPEWRFIPNAEAGDSLAMIQVPAAVIGGDSIGPVWFTARPTEHFRRFMGPLMDRPIDGALGGSAWQHVVLVLDYPRARAAVIPRDP